LPPTQPNYRLIAIQVGDAIKFDSTINEINRLGGALLRLQRESFPNDAITSQRAQLVHDWVLTLAKQRMNPEERDRLLADFCLQISPEQQRAAVAQILVDNGVRAGSRENMEAFGRRAFHPTVTQHARALFLQNNYFHAVFEAAKVYNAEVKKKSRSQKDGHPLMLDVWGAEKGTLKLTPCKTETDRNVQDGVKFLSAGLMQAIRNPTAHEPALDWPINREDCLDVLSFLSFLFRQLDKAVYYQGTA
jgi:uncharacterized protein (TIGR02391 family)